MVALFLCGASMQATAQVPEADSDSPIEWSALVRPNFSAGAGNAILHLSGALQAGWHVYAYDQAPGGPTPLRISIAEDGVAHVLGPPSGTAPQKTYDQSFGLETQFFSGDFVIDLPLQLNADPHSAAPIVPVSVRFQTCNGQECRPPKTVRLPAPLERDPVSLGSPR